MEALAGSARQARPGGHDRRPGLDMRTLSRDTMRSAPDSVLMLQARRQCFGVPHSCAPSCVATAQPALCTHAQYLPVYDLPVCIQQQPNLMNNFYTSTNILAILSGCHTQALGPRHSKTTIAVHACGPGPATRSFGAQPPITNLDWPPSVLSLHTCSPSSILTHPPFEGAPQDARPWTHLTVTLNPVTFGASDACAIGTPSAPRLWPKCRSSGAAPTRKRRRKPIAGHPSATARTTTETAWALAHNRRSCLRCDEHCRRVSTT